MLNIRLHGPSYSTIQFPAGETHVRLNPEVLDQIAKLQPQAFSQIRILGFSRADFDMTLGMADVMELALLCDAIYGANPLVMVDLMLPYLSFSRADRRFMPGDCHGLATFGRLLTAIGFARIVTLDVHNPETAVYHIPNLVNVNAEPMIRQAVTQFARLHSSPRINVLCPDAGAVTRYLWHNINAASVPDLGQITVNLQYCSKHRDPGTGKLSGFQVPQLPAGIPTIIVDDLCDGGGTFLGIASEIAKQPGAGPLALYTTHGIYSKGIGELNLRFNRLYTANPCGPAALANPVIKLDSWPLLLAA